VRPTWDPIPVQGKTDDLGTTFHGNLKYMRLAWFAISPEGRTSDACPTETPAWSFGTKNLGTASNETRATPASQVEEKRGNPCGSPRSWRAVPGDDLWIS